MFARVRYTVAAAAGLLLGAIGVAAAPAAAAGWVGLGVFVGVMVTFLRRQDTPTGAVPPGAGAGRRAGLRAGA